MPTLSARIPYCVLVAATLAAACGRDAKSADDSAAAESAAAASTDSAATPPSAATTDTNAADAGASAALTVDDIDRWKRGMEGELQAVHDAAAKLREAKSGTDTVTAMMAANDMGTRAAGAKAAGVDEERYQLIRTTFSNAVGHLSPIEQEMNVSQLPAAAVAELKKSREAGVAQATAGLAPEVVEALRARAADLRKQDLALTAERLKAAGMAR